MHLLSVCVCLAHTQCHEGSSHMPLPGAVLSLLFHSERQRHREVTVLAREHTATMAEADFLAGPEGCDVGGWPSPGPR